MSILDILYTVFIMPLQLSFEVIYVVTDRIIGNPGLSIIALSLMMNFLVLPLYMRADKMQENERDMEARLRDGVRHIRKTFSGDEKSMMLSTYYRQNGYRPTDVFKGSISLFLEIPFFISAYMFLSNLPAIRGVPFGPIADLGAPDGMLVVGGLAINVLPFVMTGINLVSCALFTKGMPVKTKVQLYGMAAFFLVFLYASPAGLVFYWTLNNLFALVKTVFYKLKNPKRVLKIMGAVAGVALIVFAAFFYKTPNIRNIVFVIILGCACIAPLVATFLRKRISWRPKPSGHTPSKRVFLAGTIFLTLFLGVFIPSSVIASSPQEFVSIYHFSSPIWFIVRSGCLAVGMFLVWFSVFYWLCNRRAKLIFETAIWAVCCTAVITYMFFGTNLGTLSPALQYEGGMAFEQTEVLLNAAIVVATVIVAAVIARRFRKTISRLLPIATAAVVVLSGMSIVTINGSIEQLSASIGSGSSSKPSIPLSRSGKNVVVIMLDRAMNEYVPYLFNEKPELASQFAGFTYYDNVVSHGGSTNFGLPGVFGGYEYTPEEMNKRDQESLESKHNEALKVMPALFNDAGFDVTVCDPSYAGYQWIPDLSIYKDYPNINTYITRGYFTDAWPEISAANMRNFFCYAITKTSPLAIQPILYDNGKYNSSGMQGGAEQPNGQKVNEDLMTAEGINGAFMDPYSVLENIQNITEIHDGNTGTFLMMTNDTTHEQNLMQTPEYTVSPHVDNTNYVESDPKRYDINGTTLRMDDPLQVLHYHANMAAFLQLGRWFDYLREQGVYDNTRIILVADHGYHLNQLPGMLLEDNDNFQYDIEFYYPLLMCKDFDATELKTSNEFMTNADTPTLATQGLIEKPTNPFTGKQIDGSEKLAGPQHIYSSLDWTIDENNGNTFKPGGIWFAVHDDMRKLRNWSEIPDPNASE